MFERYTEKARRVIFFSRYEASHYGSPFIESEHLLLGLLREDRALLGLFPPGSNESIRAQIDKHTLVEKKTSVAVDLPLSHECRRILMYGLEEAERLRHEHIGTEHLFLGLHRERGCFAERILKERGLSLEKSREHFGKTWSIEAAKRSSSEANLGLPRIEIHGRLWDPEIIRERVQLLRQSNWHWQKKTWKALDLAVGKDGAVSLDLSLVNDSKKFQLQQSAFKKDNCLLCRWELFESEDQPQHGTAYTNGRNWVCDECYHKFLEGPDYFATSLPEIT